LEEELKKKGLVFNHPDKKPFIDALRANGFYKDAKERFGAEGWSILEKFSGPL
jgi:hypothetical protein